MTAGSLTASRRWTVLAALGLLAAVAPALAPTRAAAQSLVTEFPLPTAVADPRGIAAGPDGNLWFTERGSNKIGRITPAGVVTEFLVPTPGSGPDGITAGPDGNLWFTETSANKIGRITPTGFITEFPVPTPASQPIAITAAPDGNLWFTQFSGNQIGRITTAGVITEFPVPTAGSQPFGITVRSFDGNLWFTEFGGNQIGRITPAGVVTEFPLPTPGSQPVGITQGPDGNLWFTEFGGNQIGRITPTGNITEFPLPALGSPAGIAPGSDGHLWFAERSGHRIGRITLTGVITEFPTPTTISQPFGITAGPDGNLWFTDEEGNQIGRITPRVMLTVSREGTGSGTVTGDPFGINCGAACSQLFDVGTVVTLTATPAAGSVFAGWAGDGDCSDGSVTMTAPRSCTAVFNLPAATQFTLSVAKPGNGTGTVSSNPAGIGCGADCVQAYEQGTAVALTPVADAGSVFAGWGGDADCADGVVTMTADRACSATFSLIGATQFTLSVSRAGNGGGRVASAPPGIDCGVDCTEAYAAGAGVVLVPAPDAGSVFFGWGGDADCVDGAVTMNAARACVAVFSVPGSTQFALSVQRTGTGTGAVVSAPAGITCGGDCAELYFGGTDVLLAAIPAAGSTFVGWGGPPDCLDGIVTVTAPLTCTAEFALLQVDPVTPVVPDGQSLDPALSDDGRFVAFESAAPRLTPECASGRHVYVRDRVTGGVQCVSRTASGPGAGASSRPSISGDGRVVAFQSAAPNLVSGCTTNGAQVLVRRLETGEMLCASVGGSGEPADAPSGAPALSRDGRYVAFESDASNVVPACGTGVTQVFVRDLVTLTTTCVSLGPAGPGDLASGGPAISRLGDVVVFHSNARTFAGSGCAGGQQVFAWDRASGTLTCLSRGPDGSAGNAASLAPAVSDSGLLVGFESDATNLAPECRNGIRQVFLHDRSTGAVRCVSLAADGQPGNDSSTDVALSGDGLVVAFATEATNLTAAGSASSQSARAGVVAQAGGLSQVVLRSSAVGSALSLMSQTGGTPGTGLSRRPALDRTGSVVVFQTSAANLVPGDTNGVEDVVVVTRAPAPPGCPTVGRPCFTSPLDFSQFLAPTTIALAWSPVTGAAFYGVEHTGAGLTFANPNGAEADPVNGFGGAGGGLRVDGTALAAPVGDDFPPGAYQVRVIAFGAGGQVLGTFSDALTVIVGEVASPVPASARVTLTDPAPDSILVPGGAARVAWTALVGVQRYLLEVAGPGRPFSLPNATTLSDPAAVARLPVDDTALSGPVPPGVPSGVYQIRVIGLSPAGSPVGSFSDAVSVIVP
jgi:streptogramin lyase